jgi:hypothetical protein
MNLGLSSPASLRRDDKPSGPTGPAGLSEELKLAFPDISPAYIPLLLDKGVIDPN